MQCLRYVRQLLICFLHSAHSYYSQFLTPKRRKVTINHCESTPNIFSITCLTELMKITSELFPNQSSEFPTNGCSLGNMVWGIIFLKRFFFGLYYVRLILQFWNLFLGEVVSINCIVITIMHLHTIMSIWNFSLSFKHFLFYASLISRMIIFGIFPGQYFNLD